MDWERIAADHYRRPALTETIRDALALSGKSADRLAKPLWRLMR